MTSPTFDGEAAAQWLRVTAPEDAAILDTIAAAVTVYVNSLPAVHRTEAGEWAEDTYLGALMLAGRLFRRRNSPNGIESFSEIGGTAYVARHDPDIARLLRVDTPAVG